MKLLNIIWCKRGNKVRKAHYRHQNIKQGLQQCLTSSRTQKAAAAVSRVDRSTDN